MNIAILLIISLPILALAYLFYTSYISKAIGLKEKEPAPSMYMADHRDYVPTTKPVLFGHHFASIAGAGPIVGPTIALLFGYMPVWLWLIIGGIFFGAVHDFTSLFVSIKEKGKSMAEVANKTLGKTGFILFISFTIVMIVLVTSAFLGLTAKALTSLAPLKILGLDSSQTLLKTVVEGGVDKGKIGGIASTSVIIMTLLAPLIGYLLFKRKMNAIVMTIIAALVALMSIYVGFLYPVTLDPKVWMIIITIYVFFAAGIPVWFILQPRDFTNVHILYAGIVVMIAGILAVGTKGGATMAPAFNVIEANMSPELGLIWPVLFITVACGAISGFHALVAGGTTSKQIKYEGHAKTVGYGGMLLETILAVCVVLTIVGGLEFADFKSIVFPAEATASNPILAFALGMGNLLKIGFGLPQVFGSIFGILMVEGFVITSLDTAVRLNRYLFEELWLAIFRKPAKIFRSYFFNAGLSVALMFFLGYTNAYITIWPMFGTANQLLAALTLIAVSAWLLSKRKRCWFTIYPALFMLATTFASLFMLLFGKYLPAGNFPLVIADVLLILLSFGVFGKAVNVFIEHRREKELSKKEIIPTHIEELPSMRD